MVGRGRGEDHRQIVDLKVTNAMGSSDTRDSMTSSDALAHLLQNSGGPRMRGVRKSVDGLAGIVVTQASNEQHQTPRRLGRP